MRTKLIFIADDGTKFDCEEDCFRYEQDMNQRELEGSIFFFDCDGDPLPLSVSGLQKAYLIISKSKKASQVACKIFDDGYSHPFGEEKEGTWCYMNEEWMPVNVLFAITDMIKGIQASIK